MHALMKQSYFVEKLRILTFQPPFVIQLERFAFWHLAIPQVEVKIIHYGSFRFLSVLLLIKINDFFTSANNLPASCHIYIVASSAKVFIKRINFVLWQ